MADVSLEALDNELDELEAAFTAVFIDGMSYRQAGKKLNCTAVTVKKRAYKYRELLKRLRAEGDKEDFVAEYEAQLQTLVRQANQVFEAAQGKPLTQVAALNSKKAALDNLMKVRGLEAPKEDKAKVEGRLEIVWGDDSGNG